MKRLHIHLAVADLDQSIRFYSTLFAAAPNITKDDYAKWMLDDPRVNFAVSTRGAAAGLNHLGMQVESGEELDGMHDRLQQLQGTVTAEIGTACCYAESNKYWVTDPQGIPWETFHTLNSIPVFGATASPTGDACCVPAAASQHEAASQCCAPAPTDKAAASSKCC